MIAAYEGIQPGAFLQGDNRPDVAPSEVQLAVALDSPRSMSVLVVALAQLEQTNARKDATGLLPARPGKWRAKGGASRQQAREGQGKEVGKGLELREKTSSDGVVCECSLYSFLSFNMLSERV